MNTAFPHLRILLVDDSEDDLLMAKTVFSKLSFPHKLYTLNSASEALAYLRYSGEYATRKQCMPDLLLLDINMPGMDGFTLLRELKSDKVLKKIPAIMLTTSAAPNDIRKCYECGAASFLIKPENMEGFKHLMSNFAKYWLTVSILPQ